MATYEGKISRINEQGEREQVTYQMTDEEVIAKLPPYVALSLDTAQIAVGESATLSMQLQSQPLEDESRVNVARVVSVAVVIGDALPIAVATDANGAATETINGVYAGVYTISVDGPAHNELEFEVI